MLFLEPKISEKEKNWEDSLRSAQIHEINPVGGRSECGFDRHRK